MTETTNTSLEKELTFKQKRWLKYYLETGNATQAALKAYETDDSGSAAVIGSENLMKLKNPIKTYMESKGISLGKLVEVLGEGLEATRASNAAILLTTDGKTIKAEEQGLIEIPDHLTRHKYLETAAKWLGVQQETPQTLVQVNNVTPEQLRDEQLNDLVA